MDEEETAYANISPDFFFRPPVAGWLSSAPVVFHQVVVLVGPLHTLAAGSSCLSSGRAGQEGGACGTGSTGYQDWGQGDAEVTLQ